MKYKKEELEKLIFEDNLSYRKIGEIYGVSDTYIKKVCEKLDIILPIRKVHPKDFKPAIYGTGKILECKNCCKQLNKNGWTINKFCNLTCHGQFKSKKKYEDYLKNQESFCYDRDMKFIKPHILLEQNCKCLRCGINNEWNGELLIFVLDHIDGDASNNRRENLRLVCHNCDSQLDTYKSKNKNSSRKERYLKNYKI